MRKGKLESNQVYWLSPRLMALLDYFMHKAPYWSVQNYEKRVDEGVRVAFLQHVERIHADNRSELAGLCVPLHHGRHGCLVFCFQCVSLFDDSQCHWLGRYMDERGRVNYRPECQCQQQEAEW